MSTDKFFDALKQWSERKHRLLEKYLHPFTAKTGSRFKDVFCIDAFAGAARYGDDREGSPLLLARLADTAANWSRPVSLKLINVEAKKSHYDSLCHETAEWVERGVVTNLHGEFSDLITTILNQIRHHPAFFFIDPYGTTKIPFSCLLPILERNVSATELFINFNVNGLRRLADCFHARGDSKANPEALLKTVNHVTAFLGSDTWKYYFENAVKDSERDKKLLSIYMDSLTRYGYHVAAYPIRQTFDSAPKYYMIFCTRHIDGVDLMSNFIRMEEDTLLGETVDKSTPLFDIFNPVALDRQERLNSLRTDIVNYFSTAKQTTRNSCRKALVTKNFGLYLTKEYTAVFQSLFDEGIIKVVDGRKRINENTLLCLTSIT